MFAPHATLPLQFLPGILSPHIFDLIACVDFSSIDINWVLIWSYNREMADRLTRIAIVSSDRCKPKKCRQECKKSCPVVKTGKVWFFNSNFNLYRSVGYIFLPVDFILRSRFWILSFVQYHMYFIYVLCYVIGYELWFFLIYLFIYFAKLLDWKLWWLWLTFNTLYGLIT